MGKFQVERYGWELRNKAGRCCLAEEIVVIFPKESGIGI